MDGEDLYLIVFEEIARNADYLQPDDRRLMLPEATIMSAVAVALAALASGLWTGFAQKLGGNVAERLTALAAQSRSRKLKPEELAQAATELSPRLAQEGVDWNLISSSIALELTRAGFTDTKSFEIAANVCRRLRPTDA